MPITKHGLADTPLYNVWKSIKQRCYGKNREAYKRYGAKGVVMCDEWLHNPEKFIEWALKNGWKKGLQIDKDKISNKLGVPALIYSPEMCSVLTREENCPFKGIEKYIEYNGQSKTIKEWSVERNIPYNALKARFGKNIKMSIAEALTRPIEKQGKKRNKKPKLYIKKRRIVTYEFDCRHHLVDKIWEEGLLRNVHILMKDGTELEFSKRGNKKAIEEAEHYLQSICYGNFKL